MARDAPDEVLHYPPEVHQAEGALSARLDIDIDAGVQVLRDRATARGITVLCAALEVLDRVPPQDRQPLDPWGSC